MRRIYVKLEVKIYDDSLTDSEIEDMIQDGIDGNVSSTSVESIEVTEVKP